MYDGAGSCSDRIAVCLSDAVCNRYLALVLGACNAAKCSHDSCQRLARQFYSSMPHNIAEMLVMCECEASDEDCVGMKTALHTGTCGDELRMCQDTVDHCVKDGDCRYDATLVLQKKQNSRQDKTLEGNIKPLMHFTGLHTMLKLLHVYTYHVLSYWEVVGMLMELQASDRISRLRFRSTALSHSEIKSSTRRKFLYISGLQKCALLTFILVFW